MHRLDYGGSCIDIRFREMLTKPPIDIASDGLPADPKLRRIAMRLRFTASRNRDHRFNPHHLAQNAAGFTGDMMVYLDVLNALTKAGTIIGEHHSYRFNEPARLVDDTPEARRSNYEAVAVRAAQRLVSSPAARDKAQALFTEVRNLHGVHRQENAAGGVVVVPTRLRLDENGAHCCEALVIHAGARGLRVLTAGPEAFASDPIAAVAPVDLNLCLETRNRGLQDYVSCFTPQQALLAGDANKAAKRATRSLQPHREAAEHLIGEALSTEAWRSFIGTLALAGQLQRLVRGAVFASLDRETRRAAMRHPRATFEFYNWLCGPDDATHLRRLQASAAFPILSELLPSLSSAIDNGEELIPAIAQALEIPKAVVRRLQGVTWQTQRGHSSILLGLAQHHALRRLLNQLPLEALPVSGSDWRKAEQTAQKVSSNVGFPAPDKLVRAISHDWQDNDLATAWDGFKDFANVVRAAVEKRYRATGWHAGAIGDDGIAADPVTPYVRAVANVVAGNASAKRIRRFSQAWHRSFNRLRLAKDRIVGLAHGREELRWAALTASPFHHERGTITWLTSEEEVIIEGDEMDHCVGAYAGYCIGGTTHIGSVRATDGSRATVEIHLGKIGRKYGISVSQHRSHSNSDPSANCEALVAAFEASVVKTPGKLQVREIRRVAKSQPASVTISDIDLTDEQAAELLAVYDTLGIRLTPEQWRDRVEQERALMPSSPADVEVPVMDALL